MGSDRRRQGKPCRSVPKPQGMGNSPVGTGTSKKRMPPRYSNTLVSVRKVTQENKGKRTHGVDGVKVLTPEARGRKVDLMITFQPWHVRPALRVYIPKANGKQRPLGIPTVMDRCLQARVKNALEPRWEATFEASSYGFRPGRSCHDAM